MKLYKSDHQRKKPVLSAAALLFWLIVLPLVFPWQTFGQTPPGEQSKSPETFENNRFDVNRDFRVEKIPVAGGAELITVFADLKGLADAPATNAEAVPLVSVLRDTLGDDKVENDRLRYVWMLTYAKPSLSQRAASFVPFLYTRTTNKKDVEKKAPPPVIDINPSRREVWDKIFWMVCRNLIVSDFTLPVRGSFLQSRENAGNYRKTAIARALAVLSLYESVEGEKILSDGEMQDIQARLLLSNKMLGSLVRNENLGRVNENNARKVEDWRGHNWELLRQYSEAQELYFEPLTMPDGSATHALVWTTAEDLAANKDKNFDKRFLNIKSPWNDGRLTKWNGYRQTRWFDENNQPAAPDAPGARPKTMIPLALYGLDYPKIPTLLVDFRDRGNAKKREMSKRILTDLTQNVLSISRFSSVPLFVGRYVYDFVTKQRGMDVNQQSRFQSYSQLKLLLSLDASLEPEFRGEIADRLEAVSLNPLENDLKVEAKLARRQYENLLEYAKRPDGLPAKIEKDRRAEMSRLNHNVKERTLFKIGSVLSLGVYKHYEKDSSAMRAALDVRRRLDYHERFLRETARISARPEVDSDLEAVKNSLRFVAQNGNAAKPKTAQAVAKLFSITGDEQIRTLSLDSLYTINNSTAKKQLLEIYKNQTLAAEWRKLSLRYLKLALENRQRISSFDAKLISKLGE